MARTERYDRNLIVIGAGSAGLVTAYIAAAVKAKVTLIEKNKMGGDCLNTGCVPSKALIRSARYLSHIHRHQEFGVKSASAEFDFSDVMQRVRQTIEKIAPHDSVERYSKLGVECLHGEARLLSAHEVEINGDRLSANNIVIATGARPFIPPIKGIEQINYLTSDNLWYIEDLPKKLVVLGGGPVGCELAQSFNRFGSDVTQVEMLPTLLAKEDDDVSSFIQKKLSREGVHVLTGHRAVEIRQQDGEQILVCESAGGKPEIPFDALLVAVGRTANVSGFGLEDVGVDLDDTGRICVNEKLQTSIGSIYACGDVIAPYQFTHTAAHQAWYAAVNALFGKIRAFNVDYSVIPWVTFTDPEVARVGMSESDAQKANIDYEVTLFDIGELDRAITENEAEGFIKVITRKNSDRILGATIVADHAGELITEYILAMKQRFGLNKILGTIHSYPTMSEANKYAAGEWKRNHAPGWALKLLQHFHNWMRR